MFKFALKKLLVKLGLRKSDVTPPLINKSEVAEGSYQELALNLINQANKEYSTSHSSSLDIDSMTTPNELAFLEVYGRNAFTGNGKIIDLGCWFGATSASLAVGLNANPMASVTDVVEAYDLFEWDHWMDPIKESIGMKVNLKAGDCFLNIVEQNLSEYANRINFHKQDLSNYNLPAEWSIEFLFVDAMKNWDLAGSISRTFFTRLIPERSIMVMQDFAFYDPIVATNHLLMWHLRDCFKPLHHVPYSCSVVFLTLRVPTAEDLLDYSPDSFTEEEVDQAYEYCIPLIQEFMQPSLYVAKLCHHLQCQHKEGSLRAIQNLKGMKISAPMRETIIRSLDEPYISASSSWQACESELRSALSALAVS